MTTTTAVYVAGSEAILSTAFRDVNGTLADPTTVSLTVKDPSGSVHTYGVGTGIVKDAGLGAYHYLLLLDEEGEWFYAWSGTGAVATVSQGSLVVRRLLA